MSDSDTSLPAPLRLDLDLAPEDIPLLLRQPELRKVGRSRNAVRRSIVWHESPEAALAAHGLALARDQEGPAATPVWRVERLVADDEQIWPPGGPAPVVEQAESRETLRHRLPAQLLPAAAFEGQVRLLPTVDPALHATLLDGTLRAVTATSPVCRVLLEGPGAAATAFGWSQRLRLAAPRLSLAGEALALAGHIVPTRPLGAPSLPAAFDVEDGFAFIVAHLSGVMLHHAPKAAKGEGMEPVHQMRVALRRLRSALMLFRRALACPELDEVAERLKELGRVLGPPRDWDVFTAGVGRAVGGAFAEDKSVMQLLEAAERRRQGGYKALAAYLDGGAFRGLMILLAGLALGRPWTRQVPEAAGDEEAAEAEKRHELQHASLKDYAAKALSRRLAKVTAPGPDLSGLPDAALHEIRLHTKRLRYATEFFAPLFPGRETTRFLRRMADLQEHLGQLNDGAVAAALMAELPHSGLDRRSAIGVVRGFVAARASGGRRQIDESWKRFLKLEPFWR